MWLPIRRHSHKLVGWVKQQHGTLLFNYSGAQFQFSAYLMDVCFFSFSLWHPPDYGCHVLTGRQN